MSSMHHRKASYEHSGDLNCSLCEMGWRDGHADVRVGESRQSCQLQVEGQRLRRDASLREVIQETR